MKERFAEQKRHITQAARDSWHGLMSQPITNWSRNRWLNRGLLTTTGATSGVITALTEHPSIATSLGGSLAAGAAVAVGLIAEKKGILGLEHLNRQPVQSNESFVQVPTDTQRVGTERQVETPLFVNTDAVMPREAPSPVEVVEEVEEVKEVKEETLKEVITRLNEHPLLVTEEQAFRRAGRDLPNTFRTDDPAVMFALIDALCPEKRFKYENAYNARLQQLQFTPPTREVQQDYERGVMANLPEIPDIPLHLEMVSSLYYPDGRTFDEPIELSLDEIATRDIDPPETKHEFLPRFYTSAFLTPIRRI